MGLIRTITILLSGYMLYGAFRLIMGLILPGLTSAFELSPLESGIFASAPVLSSLMTMAIAGYISDRFGRRRVLTIGMSVLWSAALLASISPSFSLALFFVFVAGMGGGFLPPDVYSIMGNLRSRSRATFVGMAGSAYNIGGFAGSIGLGFAIAFEGWRFGLVLLSMLGLILIPFTFVLIETHSDRQPSEKKVAYFGEMLRLLKSRQVALAGASLFMAMYASFVIISWTPTYLINFGISLTLSGLVMGVYSLAGGVSTILLGRLADVWGERRLIISTGTMAAVVSLQVFVSKLDFFFAALLMMLLGFLLWPSWNLITSMVQRLTDPSSVGTITGVVQTLGMAGAFLGPIVTGSLIKSWGLELTMLASVIVTICLYVTAIIPSSNKPCA